MLAALDTVHPPLATKVMALGQLAFCQGCCCGRTDRGKPGLPVERLKAVWKAEKINRTVQLTVSGCLGPCDLTNVTVLLTPNGSLAGSAGGCGGVQGADRLGAGESRSRRTAAAARVA